MTTLNYLIKVIKYLLAALFVYAGFYKLADIPLFQTQMHESPLLPAVLVPVIAYLLPVGEIFLGFFLIFSKRYNRLLLGFASSLLLFFTLYLIALFTGYSRPPCACGGILNGMGYPVHIAFNCFFTLLALAGYLLVSRGWKNTVVDVRVNAH